MDERIKFFFGLDVHKDSGTSPSEVEIRCQIAVARDRQLVADNVSSP